MGIESELKLIVKSSNIGTTTHIIRSSPQTINNLNDAINGLSKKYKKDENINITPIKNGFILDSKSYMALQKVIYSVIK